MPFRGGIKPAFQLEGSMPYLVQRSLQGSMRATRGIGEILQGWELIRYVSHFEPFDEKDVSLARVLNATRNRKTTLEATITHTITRNKHQTLRYVMSNELLIPLLDYR